MAIIPGEQQGRGRGPIDEHGGAMAWTAAMTKRPPKSKEAEDEKPRGGRARSVAEMLPDVGGAAFRRLPGYRSKLHQCVLD